MPSRMSFLSISRIPTTICLSRCFKCREASSARGFDRGGDDAGVSAFAACGRTGLSYQRSGNAAVAGKQTILVRLPVCREIENILLNFSTAIEIAFEDDQLVTEAIAFG